jgi:hypothetical protein
MRMKMDGAKECKESKSGKRPLIVGDAIVARLLAWGIRRTLAPNEYAR